MKILAEYTDEQVREIASRPAPEPMAGEWTLIAPDGRSWTAAGPMSCAAAESRDRVPTLVALARIRRAMFDA